LKSTIGSRIAARRHAQPDDQRCEHPRGDSLDPQPIGEPGGDQQAEERGHERDPTAQGGGVLDGHLEDERAEQHLDGREQQDAHHEPEDLDVESGQDERGDEQSAAFARR
jgi:hypothetical protein